ncbi:MAG TPA: ABC transporter substrate-binding protein [Arachnia sp.]|nr:ABC transporter substrate-binding protein [Arachnia sp.]HMT85573.1 ABC transporter substrate-binding protein [Arachnia sp.]
MIASARPGRTAGLLALALGAALVLTGCAADSDAGAPDDTTAPDSTTTPTTAPETPEAFPVTVETVYGELTIDEKPERIIALTGAYLDTLVALDEEPVAFAGSPRANDDFLAGYPWFDGVVNMDNWDPSVSEYYAPVLEAIAAYEPDLILGDGDEWSISEEMYKEISLIAPTYTNPHGYDGWQGVLTDVGALTGKSEQAADVIAEVEAEIADARERLPGLQGASMVTADSREPGSFELGGGAFLLTELGLVPDDELVATENLSLENLDQLDSDVLVFMTFFADNIGDALGREKVEADPRFASLPAVANGTVLWTGAPLVNATADTGPRAISWWLEQIVPQLEESALNTAGQQ